jgi:hypothetical protein
MKRRLGFPWLDQEATVERRCSVRHILADIKTIRLPRTGLSNLMVMLADNKYIISGILDWEYSGFYPDYYESVRNHLWMTMIIDEETWRTHSPPDAGSRTERFQNLQGQWLVYGDIRPDNLMVMLADNKYIISGILDWEYSGFYPDYYRSHRWA